ncbi:hypothetical protein ACWDSJ_25625 [Nocardia sp. NPDC003482]|uniref:hypothetical protein n=1 Tax=Nocardia sp. NPDC004068 TaxID=3364303 RepID=UPI00369D6BB2
MASWVPLIAAVLGVLATAVLLAYGGYIADYRRRVRAAFRTAPLAADEPAMSAPPLSGAS